MAETAITISINQGLDHVTRSDLVEALTIFESLFRGGPTSFSADLFGTVNDIVEPAKESRDRFGFSSWSLLGRTSADLTPVVEALR